MDQKINIVIALSMATLIISGAQFFGEKKTIDGSRVRSIDNLSFSSTQEGSPTSRQASEEECYLWFELCDVYSEICRREGGPDPECNAAMIAYQECMRKNNNDLNACTPLLKEIPKNCRGAKESSACQNERYFCNAWLNCETAQ